MSGMEAIHIAEHAEAMVDSLGFAGAIQVEMWTPLVTAFTGTTPSGLPDQSGTHILLAISRCRRLTALTISAVPVQDALFRSLFGLRDAMHRWRLAGKG